MTKKLLPLISVLLIAAMALAACAKPTEAPVAPEAPVVEPEAPVATEAPVVTEAPANPSSSPCGPKKAKLMVVCSMSPA